jgi:hypothetical protein
MDIDRYSHIRRAREMEREISVIEQRDGAYKGRNYYLRFGYEKTHTHTNHFTDGLLIRPSSHSFFVFISSSVTAISYNFKRK